MLRLRTLGASLLERADGSPIVLQRRPLALLAFIAAAGRQGTSRERALALLWPDIDEGRARHSLAQTLYALRRACDADAIAGTSTLRVNDALVAVDLAEMEHALATGEPERAATLYGGPFLDGFHLQGAGEFERWLEVQRTHVARRAARALEASAVRAAERGDAHAAVEWWRRLAALDPLDSRIALALIERLAAAGDVAGALRHARAHQALRRSELDLAPDRDVAALVSRLRGRVDHAHETPSPAAPAPAAPAAPPPSPASPASPAAAPPATDEQTPPPPPPPGERRRAARRRPLRWVAAAVIAATGIAAAILLVRPERSLNRRRVVVAVFENLTSDTAFAPLGDMAADWVATELARTGLVDVVDSRAVIGSGAMTRARDEPPASIARMRELARGAGAGLLVWGTYYKRGDTLEFHAQVTDVRDGSLLREVPPIAVPAREPMSALRRLSSRIMGALATLENPRLAEWAAQGGTPPSYEAYREFVDGLEAQVHMDPAAALAHYQRASALDSTFLQPLLFGADAERQLGQPARADSTLGRLIAVRDRLIPADRALLDFQLAELHGRVERAYDAAREMARTSPTSESFVIAGQAALDVGRPREALRWFERVNPNEGWVRGWAEYWQYVVASAHLAGDDQEALRVAHDGRRAFPDQLATYACLAPPMAALGEVAPLMAALDSAAAAPGTAGWRYDELLDDAASELAAHGHQDAARQVWERAARWYADRPRDAAWLPAMRDLRARVLLRLGRAADAERLAQALVHDYPGNDIYAATLATTSAAAGDSSTARALAQRLAERAASAGDGPNAELLPAARAAAAVGDRADAMALLRTAVGTGAVSRYSLHRSPDFRALWGGSSFRELVWAHR